MNVSYNVWYVTNEQIVFQLLCRCAVTTTWNTPLFPAGGKMISAIVSILG